MIDDLADATHDPQFFDEGITFVVTLFDQVCREVELLFAAGDATLDDDLRRARFFVAADDDQLLALEEVEVRFWVDAVDRWLACEVDAIEFKFYRDVCQYRSADVAVNRAHMCLDIFAGRDILRTPGSVTRDAVEQPTVHVIADAKRQNSCPERIRCCRTGRDLSFIRDTSRGQAIRQKQDIVWTGVVCELVQCRGERLVNVRATAGRESRHVTERRLACLLVIFY